jgi:hypothetical protein
MVRLTERVSSAGSNAGIRQSAEMSFRGTKNVPEKVWVLETSGGLTTVVI